ncbi:hypothetical protein EPA93_22540 [Ktedonosporobacter rubrisoli]|uniref:Uncharacterized protein n=1 Tax=Ktedonosporobacter rubrisoli TaxID=2509675 RepID=A0A4P6JST8_KTERU|nr:hypothetical protein [Ktedonosporobacter rubrisoli]QBD78619.1 hypothetical protein EPA93_22540 [Ktedonosporobacter rubrisoli]
MQLEPALVYQAFSALCEMRRLTKAGYARFRNFLLYGGRNLAGEIVKIDIFQDVLTLDYHLERLSRYSVEWQPDDHHIARGGRTDSITTGIGLGNWSCGNRAKWSGL